MAKEHFTPRPSSEWLQKTACNLQDQELFFKPVKTKEEQKTLKALCDSCEVKRECLDDAMYYNDVDFFRAGKTPEELKGELRIRRAIKRSQQ